MQPVITQDDGNGMNLGEGGCQHVPRQVLRGPESRRRHWSVTAGAEGVRGRPQPGRRSRFTPSAQSNCLIPESRQETVNFSRLLRGGEFLCLGTSACFLLTFTPPRKALVKGRCERKKTDKKESLVGFLPTPLPPRGNHSF